MLLTISYHGFCFPSPDKLLAVLKSMRCLSRRNPKVKCHLTISSSAGSNFLPSDALSRITWSNPLLFCPNPISSVMISGSSTVPCAPRSYGHTPSKALMFHTCSRNFQTNAVVYIRIQHAVIVLRWELRKPRQNYIIESCLRTMKLHTSGVAPT